MSRLQEMFDKDESVFHRFDETIPADKRLHPNRDLCGLLKVASLMIDPEKFDMHAEHDVVYLAHEGEIREDITDEDVIYLKACGIFYDSEFECLSKFT